MLNLKCLAFLFGFIIICKVAYAQAGFSHELGVIAGPLQFKSDYGARGDNQTNYGNSGFGIGIVHFMNFSFRADCNCYTTDKYFNDHFKVRNEISWNRTKLEHIGKWVASNKTSETAKQLRGHTGIAKNLDLGTQIEFFPRSIRRYQAYAFKVAPYVSLGVHYTNFSPQVETTYNHPDSAVEFGDITDERNFYDPWAPGSVDASSGSAFSLVSSAGFRYKAGRFSDIIVDLRWQYYFSDWIDGLNHDLNSNKNNDWLVWLNVGYVFYLN